MSEKKSEDVIALAQEAMVLSLATPDTNPAPTCKPEDKECFQRWVQAFSDCE